MSATVQEEKVAAPPREQVLTAIQQEAECASRSAAAALNWLERVVVPDLEEDGDDYEPTEKEMSGIAYRIVDRIMPHGQRSREGTAHRLIEQFLGFPAGSLVHDQVEDAVKGTYCDFYLKRDDPES